MAVAIVAGAGGAYAVTRDSPAQERQAFLSDLAKRLGVSTSQLTNAIQGAFFDRLDAAVAAGRLTKAQADAIKQHVREHGRVPFFGPGRFFGGPHPFPGGPFGKLDAAAKYLGLSDAQLFAKLRSGKSLAQVAKDEGKSVDGLKQAMKDAVRQRLDAAVAAKRITKAQEDRILNALDSRLDVLVQGLRFGPRFERRHFGWRGWHRPGWGPPGPPPGPPPF